MAANLAGIIAVETKHLNSCCSVYMNALAVTINSIHLRGQSESSLVYRGAAMTRNSYTMLVFIASG